MKYLHYADLHITEGPRLEDQEHVLKFIEATAKHEDVDLVLVAGDLSNQIPRRATPREREVVRMHFQRLAELCPVVVVRGNHDYHLDWEFLNDIECDQGIHYIERAQAVRVMTRSGVEIHVLAVPWPDRGALADQVEGGRDDISEVMRRAVRGILQGLEMESRGKLRVGLAHCNLVGTTIDNGQPLIGDDFELGVEDLAPIAPLWCLGHIHKHQILDAPGSKMVFAGAPMQHKHGAVAPRVICIHEVDRETGDPIKTVTVDTPYRPLRTVDLWFLDSESGPGYYLDETATDDALWVTGNIGEDDVAEVVSGAEVRIRVYYQEALAEAFDRRAIRDRVLALGALAVKLEPTPLSEVKVRAPQIVEVTSLVDKVRVYLEEKGKVMEGEAAELLAAALDMLETREPSEVLEYISGRIAELEEGLI